MEPKVYFIDNREIHQFGFYVSVVWATEDREERQGNRRVVTTARDGDPPYISFLWIRNEDEETWIDEDSTVAGGLRVDQAEEMAQGLLAAAAYIRSLA